jgi:hypothetical protein
MLELLGSKFNWQVGQFDHLTTKKKKKNSLIKIFRCKKLERKNCTLGEPWIVHKIIT